MPISDAMWSKYQSLVESTQESWFKDNIKWYKSKKNTDRWGEDNLGEQFEEIELPILTQYNYFRTWPLDKTTETGNLDNENITIFITNKWLEENGYLDSEGYFIQDPERDYFIFHGKEYKDFGNTHISQASNKPLLTMLILKRQASNS